MDSVLLSPINKQYLTPLYSTVFSHWMNIVVHSEREQRCSVVRGVVEKNKLRACWQQQSNTFSQHLYEFMDIAVVGKSLAAEQQQDLIKC